MLKGQRKSGTPGFRYVGKTTTASFEVVRPGTGGKDRRRKTIVGEVLRDGARIPLTRDVALEEWKRFREEVLAPPPARPAAAPAWPPPAVRYPAQGHGSLRMSD